MDAHAPRSQTFDILGDLRRELWRKHWTAAIEKAAANPNEESMTQERKQELLNDVPPVPEWFPPFVGAGM